MSTQPPGAERYLRPNNRWRAVRLSSVAADAGGYSALAAPIGRFHAAPQLHRSNIRIVLDTSTLLWGLLFGSIGLGFFVYGRRQKKVVPLVSGLALMIFPYFVSNTILLVTLGIALIAIPYFVRM
jgi:hypothetical protein